MSSKSMRWGLFTLAILITSLSGGATMAEEIDLQEANRQFANPLTRATLWITENNYFTFDGDITDDEDKQVNVTIIDPVIPLSLGDSGWSLVTRPILPLFTNAELPAVVQDPTTPGIDFDQESGLGDFTYFAAFSPEAKSKFSWGVGPIVQLPTASRPELGSEQWSAGVMGVWVYSGNKFSAGMLNQNLFSFSGADDREDVKSSTVQYFWFYNFTPKWGIGAAPTIAFDWETDDDDNDFEFPIGLGLTHTFRMGKAPSRILISVDKYVIDKETFGRDLNFRVAWAVFLPKIGS